MNSGEFVARKKAQKMAKANSKGGERSVIIGYVCKIPTVGSTMVVRIMHTPEEELQQWDYRQTTKIISAENLDAGKVWRVITASGRTYIVEVLAR